MQAMVNSPRDGWIWVGMDVDLRGSGSDVRAVLGNGFVLGRIEVVAG